MITVLLDNDVSDHCDLLLGALRTTGWDEYHLVRFVTLREVGLPHDANDQEVWRLCQMRGLLLLTANRNQHEPTSLEETLQKENTAASLPVLTFSDPQRIAETEYREQCIHALINLVLDLSNYLGSARQYLP